MSGFRIIVILIWAAGTAVVSPIWAYAAQVHLSDKVFDLSAMIKTGTPDKLDVAVTAKGPYHCNLEYPWKLKVIQANGATFNRVLFTGKDAVTFTESKVRFLIPFQLVGAGQVELELRLSMCDDRQCYLKKVPVTVRH